ncbi:MAG: lectin like domain-containing protein [bacterium]
MKNFTISMLIVAIVLLSMTSVAPVIAQGLIITTEPIPGIPVSPAQIAPADIKPNSKSILALGNLTPYAPTGWSDKIVVTSSVSNLTTDGTVYANQTSYISWAVINNGTGNIPSAIRFYVYLYINSNFTTGWYGDGLYAGYYLYVTGYPYVFTTIGNNTLQIEADPTDAVIESNETDNSYSRVKSVSGGGPSIRISPTKLDFVNIASFIGTSSQTEPETKTVNAPTGTEDLIGQVAPLNPAFEQYQKDLAMGNINYFTANGFQLGHIPAPLDLSHLKVKSAVSESVLALPSAYDCRTAGKVTAVRNQGSAGSCWAHATYGSMESCLLPGATWDFSENNMKNLLSSAYPQGYDRAASAGGNCFMATAYLTRWTGPILETDDPYNATSGTSPTDKPVQKHIQSVYYPPSRTGATDNATLKQLILSYGGIDSGMYWDDACYNATNYAYYYSGASSDNHDITVVGWDDNFSASKFSPAAPGNGAFLIKNSWGTSWGQNGFFYLSYYDSNIGITNAQFRYTEATTNYTRVYQYDPYGWINSYGYGGTTGWFANIFTALGEENIAAVGWYAGAPNTVYEIRVYKTPDSGPINTGGAALTKTGTATESGFVTISLGTTVTVSSGQRFSVMVKATTPNYNYPIPIEYPVSNYCSKARGNPGESYISGNGTTWSDISSKFTANSNVCLKAYAKSVGQSSNSQKFTVYNDGSGTLSVTNISKTNNKSWITSIAPTSFSVPAAGSQQITVTVSASGLSVAKDTELLKIWSDDTLHNPYSGPTVTISGTPKISTMNSYGQFSTAGDTTKWYFQVYADGSGPGSLSWLPNFAGQTGVIRFQQAAGEKAKLSQTFSVPSAGWYTAKAKVATDIVLTAKQQKVYLYLQEMNSSNAIIACANEVVASGGGGFSSASSWKNLEISYYASGTGLAVQVVGINPSGSGVVGRIYFDDILVTPTAPEGYTGSSVTISNSSFTSNTAGWTIEVYADGTGPGTWSWYTGWYGRSGLIKGTQAGGEKAKISQVFSLPSSADKNTYASIWVCSGASSTANTPKVYLYLYSYNAGYGKVMESGNAVVYSGLWNPTQWKEIKFGYTPMSIYNVVQFIGINPSGKPTQSIYFDSVAVKQE